MKFFSFLLKNKIFILIFFAAFLRLYKLEERFNWALEQSLSFQPVIRFFQEKKLPLIGLHFFNYHSGIFRPPFFTYFSLFISKLFNFNPLSFAKIYIFFGVINIFLIYLAGKKIFNHTSGLIASFLYTFSFYLINTDKNVWVITPVIFSSCLITYLLTFLDRKNSFLKNNFLFFLIGSLTGLSLSFHFQTSIIFFVLLLLFLKKYNLRKTLFFLFGFFLFLSPLIIFNFRHDFITLKGIRRLVFGQEIVVKQNSAFLGKLSNSLNSFFDLALFILNLKFSTSIFMIKLSVFLVLFILPVVYLYRFKKGIFFLNYFLLSCLLTLPALIIIDQGHYSSTAFYLWFLIPPLLIIWGSFLSLFLFNNKFIFVFFCLFFLFLTLMLGLNNQQETI